MERRRATGWLTGSSAGTPVPQPVRLWQQHVHIPGIYDLEVDTSVSSPDACAAAILRRLTAGPAPSAFQRLADMPSGQD